MNAFKEKICIIHIKTVFWSWGGERMGGIRIEGNYECKQTRKGPGKDQR